MFGVVGVNSDYDYAIVTSQSPSDVFSFLLSTGVLSEFKKVTSFFVKIVEQSESNSCPIERRLALLRFGYAWDFVDDGGNIDRGKWSENGGWIKI